MHLVQLNGHANRDSSSPDIDSDELIAPRSLAKTYEITQQNEEFSTVLYRQSDQTQCTPTKNGNADNEPASINSNSKKTS